MVSLPPDQRSPTSRIALPRRAAFTEVPYEFRANDVPAKGVPLRMQKGTSVFESGPQFPMALLRQSAIEHNASTMETYCRTHGVLLAPHGKTTMAPALWRIQLQHGSWGLTAATVRQAQVMRVLGIDNVLIANQVVADAEIQWLADESSNHHSRMLACWVDSIESVQRLNAVLMDETSMTAPVRVLVELGVSKGRTGARSLAVAEAVAAEVARSPVLSLSGVAGFEGIMPITDPPSIERAIRSFSRDLGALTLRLREMGLLDGSSDKLLSVGGSAYFDYVVDELSAFEFGDDLKIVLRSGCYLTHDTHGYENTSPMGRSARLGPGFRLKPALEIWGPVLARPEPDLLVVGVGKRDISHDNALPIVQWQLTSHGVESLDGVEVERLNDQHCYLRTNRDAVHEIGDLLGFGIAHPCTTFDKWRTLLLVDDEHRLIESVATYF